jgi:hypothetical protein
MKPEFHAPRLEARKISPQSTWRFAYLFGWLVLGAMLAAGARNSHAVGIDDSWQPDATPVCFRHRQ